MSTNGNSTDGLKSSSASFSWALFVPLGIVWIPGIVCNIIALVFIIRDIRKAVFPAIFLLLILICCDLTAVIFSTLNHIVVFYIQNVPHPVCVFLSTFYVFFRVASALMNLIMAVDRYLAISQPFFYKRSVTVGTWKVTCIIACISIVVYCMFHVMGLGDVNLLKVDGSVRCSSLGYALKPNQRVFGMMFPLIGFMCTLTIVVLNMIVIRELVRLKNRVGAISLTLEGSSRTDTSGNAIAAATVKAFEVTFAKLMACLSTVYLVCGTPYNVSARQYIIILKRKRGTLYVTATCNR
ncbi:hypothetical protein DPMN_123124 [Dreissena polymorpha]|uniref:G-protein coupled receptors family 1 profile domain-containing protein n=1 Tax=Dreissena polymorpha TaxID=45954 RepID=A0A9D4JQZ8_DREPO|nr:hypothetical protein DPMN_123124 [Dreissena polymorpha]